jgi:hypothetical protein
MATLVMALVLVAGIQASVEPNNDAMAENLVNVCMVGSF